MTPSFKPKLNPKSKMIHKRLKSSNIKQKNQSEASQVTQNESEPSQKHRINGRAKIRESQESYEIENQIQYVNNDEIKEISEFINASKVSFPENDAESQAFLDVIFSDNLHNFHVSSESPSRQHNDEINDRDDIEPIRESDNENKSDYEELNNREHTYESYHSDHHDSQILENNDSHQHGSSQNGSKHITDEEYDQDDEDVKEISEQSKHRHITNDRLETVGEATIEETTKQDITLEERTPLSPDNSKILSQFTYTPVAPMTDSVKKPEELDPLQKLMMFESKTKPLSKKSTQEELGTGSMDLLNAILKQYGHIVK